MMMAVDDLFRTPFWFACAGGNVDVLDWLVLQGVPPSEMTRNSTFIHIRSLHIYIHTYIDLFSNDFHLFPCNLMHVTAPYYIYISLYV